MSGVSQIRILLADDHPVVRQGLAALINRQPRMLVVAEAATGREAVALFGAHRPDITLMDLRMPELDGVAAISAIRAVAPAARVIILTTYDSDEEIYRGLLAGAMAYLLKDATPEVLVEAIQAVHAGQKRIPQEVAAKLAERMGSPELTPRELEVLRLLVAGHSNKGIGAALAIGEGTVRTHMANILAKLQAQDRTEAATVAIRRGIVRLD
jgi:two-component system, NarL family, response regulator